MRAWQTAGLEGLKPVRTPSWLRKGEWAEPGMVPALTASSATPATGSRHHATQEHGTPPKPHPVTRAHGRRKRKVTSRQEAGDRKDR